MTNAEAELLRQWCTCGCSRKLHFADGDEPCRNPLCPCTAFTPADGKEKKPRPGFERRIKFNRHEHGVNKRRLFNA